MTVHTTEEDNLKAFQGQHNEWLHLCWHLPSHTVCVSPPPPPEMGDQPNLRHCRWFASVHCGAVVPSGATGLIITP